MKGAAYHYRQWLWRAGTGLAIIGMGVSFAIEAGIWKSQGASTLHWVLAGTGALVVLNTGISLFGDAILHRVRYERLKEHSPGRKD